MLPVHAGAGILQLCKVPRDLVQSERDRLSHDSYSVLDQLFIQSEHGIPIHSPERKHVYISKTSQSARWPCVRVRFRLIYSLLHVMNHLWVLHYGLARLCNIFLPSACKLKALSKRITPLFSLIESVNFSKIRSLGIPLCNVISNTRSPLVPNFWTSLRF